jgi:hypothetical protein
MRKKSYDIDYKVGNKSSQEMCLGNVITVNIHASFFMFIFIKATMPHTISAGFQRPLQFSRGFCPV